MSMALSPLSADGSGSNRRLSKVSDVSLGVDNPSKTSRRLSKVSDMSLGNSNSGTPRGGTERLSFSVPSPRGGSENVASLIKDSKSNDVFRIFTHKPKLKDFVRAEQPMERFFPKRHKAKVIVWADLTVDAVDRLNESLNADHVKQVLADIFELDNYKDNLRTGIKMDLFYYTLQFAREQQFSSEKISAFFSIMKRIFEVCIETPYGNLDHTFQYFKDLLLCHSVNRPPYSIELFNPHEVRKITEYAINTFFRHFKMYKYAFTPKVRLDLAINYVGMPPSPPSSESDLKGAEGGKMEDESADGGDQAEEIDEERLAAREELRGMVKDFLNKESKRIEGSVEQHLKAAVSSLNTQIDGMIEATVPDKGKKKK
ncbi:hypothetical protein EGW08_013527 [Elysia chlorotica]|uniref:Uncharacterized protein n=1 Tax=Elysia chlorotica TaxID=188477 RepID=A0A3S0ZH01_ELYCH|nr:hypothetical protein EGW08_013527 [Elysia chlorotica]